MFGRIYVFGEMKIPRENIQKKAVCRVLELSDLIYNFSKKYTERQ